MDAPHRHNLPDLQRSFPAYPAILPTVPPQIQPLTCHCYRPEDTPHRIQPLGFHDQASAEHSPDHGRRRIDVPPPAMQANTDHHNKPGVPKPNTELSAPTPAAEQPVEPKDTEEETSEEVSARPIADLALRQEVANPDEGGRQAPGEALEAQDMGSSDGRADAVVGEVESPGLDHTSEVSDRPIQRTNQTPDPPNDDTESQRHTVDKTDAARLILTVSDHIRYGLTGELPDGIERLNRRTLMDQTRYDPFFGRNTERETPEKPEPCRGLPREGLNIMDYPHFQAWSLVELAGIAKSIEEAISDPDATGKVNDILERANVWKATYRKHYRARDCPDDDLNEAVSACQSLVRPIIDSSVLPTADKACLIEAIALAHRPSADICTVRKEILTELMNGRLELCALLTHMPASIPEIEWAVHLASRLVKNKAELPRIVGITLVPLARHLSKLCKASLYGAEQEIESLAYRLSVLEHLAESSGDGQPSEIVGPHLLEAADIVAGALIGLAASIKKERPNHPLVTNSVRLLRRLYFSTYHEHGQPPKELRPFLEELFNEKFKPYMWDNVIKGLAPDFNLLAEACGLPENSRIKGH